MITLQYLFLVAGRAHRDILLGGPGGRPLPLACPRGVGGEVSIAGLGEREIGPFFVSIFCTNTKMRAGYIQRATFIRRVLFYYISQKLKSAECNVLDTEKASFRFRFVYSVTAVSSRLDYDIHTRFCSSEEDVDPCHSAAKKKNERLADILIFSGGPRPVVVLGSLFLSLWRPAVLQQYHFIFSAAAAAGAGAGAGAAVLVPVVWCCILFFWEFY